MPAPRTQTAVIQSKATPSRASGLSLAVSHSKPVLDLSSPYHVLVRVLAVGLNPTDYKMVTHFYIEGNIIGCDFCGIIESAGLSALFSPGARVCGADFPYRSDNPHNGAFSQWVVADSRQMLKVPDEWSDTQAAALGAIGWGTVCLSVSDSEALNLAGLPSKPVEKSIPVLVYGGATATGIMAIQMLKLSVTYYLIYLIYAYMLISQARSGYAPIAVCSSTSAPLVMKYGAVGTASYTSTTCVETIKSLAGGAPIKHALDCITDAQSTAICFGALSRAGGRYACLEECPESWRTRRAVKVKVVMGFEMQGNDVDLGHPVYTRKARPDLHAIGTLWAKEMQSLLDKGSITTQPIREVEGEFEGVIKALETLQSGGVRGEKLVVRLSA